MTPPTKLICRIHYYVTAMLTRRFPLLDCREVKLSAHSFLSFPVITTKPSIKPFVLQVSTFHHVYVPCQPFCLTKARSPINDELRVTTFIFFFTLSDNPLLSLWHLSLFHKQVPSCTFYIIFSSNPFPLTFTHQDVQGHKSVIHSLLLKYRTICVSDNCNTINKVDYFKSLTMITSFQVVFKVPLPPPPQSLNMTSHDQL